MQKRVLVSAIAVALMLIVSLVFVVLELHTLQPELTPLPAASRATPFYLPYPTDSESNSSILILAESVSYTTYPFESVPKIGSYPAVNRGDPCIRIDATVRSDYSLENPVPGQNFVDNNSRAYVYLSAKIYNNQSEVKATDVTPPYPDFPIPGLFLGMSPGEVDNIAIYVATDRTDITSYKIVLQAIAAMPIP